MIVGLMDGWKDGWVGRWVKVKAIPCIIYSNQKYHDLNRMKLNFQEKKILYMYFNEI
jgi:hypothetical protein